MVNIFMVLVNMPREFATIKYYIQHLPEEFLMDWMVPSSSFTCRPRVDVCLLVLITTLVLLY